MRLIDADHLRKWIINNWSTYQGTWNSVTIDAILDQIESEDTYIETEDTDDTYVIVNAVVRCKDCVYAKPFNKIWQLPIEDALVCTNFENEKVDEDFFCGCAIKKIDEEVEK